MDVSRRRAVIRAEIDTLAAQHGWPPERVTWAINVRAPHLSSWQVKPPDRALALYASPDEIAAAIAAVEAQVAEADRHIAACRAAKDRGAGQRAHRDRNAVWSLLHNLTGRSSFGNLPPIVPHRPFMSSRVELPPELERIIRRYEQAEAAGKLQEQDSRAALPIGDAEWEAELARRQEAAAADAERRRWPTREEWAQVVRTPYYDRMPERDERALSHASAEEIARLEAELAALHRDISWEKRQLQVQYPRLDQQPGETRSAHYDRRDAMTEAERAAGDSIADLQLRLRKITEERHRLSNGRLPRLRDGTSALLDTIRQRAEAAHALACERRGEEIARTPIDDAAWEEELERRRELIEGLLSRLWAG